MRIRMLIASAFLVLLLGTLSACGGASTANGDTNQPEAVTVTLADFTIQSSRTTFVVGKRYHFTVTNTGQASHELMIMMPGMDGMDMESMHQMALYHVDQSQLAPGASAGFDYTFTEPEAPGHIEFSCRLAGHYEQGMKLPIQVVRG